MPFVELQVLHQDAVHVETLLLDFEWYLGLPSGLEAIF